MWRIIVLCGLLLSAVLVVPVRTLDARGHSGGGGHSGGSSIKQTVFSPKTPVKNGVGVYSESISYLVQFDIGQHVTRVEIAPVGSTDWVPLVDSMQAPLYIRSGRIAKVSQAVFDNMYNFDIRINGTVVWPNVAVRHERLIILGYNKAPIVVAIIDHYRK